jgi:tetratricopeptide (TPR) repeat protein
VSGGRFSGARLTRTFAFTLVPIAIAYHIAHYLSFLLIQGQRIVPLLSDPFGAGWDLLGTATYRLNIGVVGARFGWYTAVLTIVIGHILAVYLAHLVALRTLRDHRLALRSQYPMLVLMVAYTVISLWILSQPIVEGSANRPTQTTVTAEAATAQPVLRSGAGTSAAPDSRAATLLAAMPLLGQNQADGDVTVRSSILCFCFLKGPETIRELRRAADAWFTKGLAAYRSGQYAAAITAFTEAIQRHPRYARAYTNRGILYGKTGAYQQAQADLTQAITLQPGQGEAHYAHGLIAALLGDATRASRDVQRAADLGYSATR